MISRKLTYILLPVFFLASAGVSFMMNKGTANAPVKNTITINDKGEVVDTGPKTEECPLNGQMFSKSQRQRWEGRRPMGAAIENHLDARPQSGLSTADVVYEAVAEGGITRFLAMYYCQEPSTIGPVRSARIYFIKLLQGYGNNPLYAHVGGANTPGPADALGEIRDLEWDGYNDLNQFAVPFPYYYRDYDRLPDRATEHTMYSSPIKLWEYAAKNRKLSQKDEDGIAWDKGWEPWKFQDDAKTADRGTTDTIDFGFWSKFDADTYAVKWTYDNASNNYVRANGGAPHIDKNTKKAMTAKNIVIAFAKESSANDGYEGGHLLYGVVGNGTGLLFQNGNEQKVTWKKPDEESMMRFYDSAGKEVEFVRGQIFVEILPTGNEVKY